MWWTVYPQYSIIFNTTHKWPQNEPILNQGCRGALVEGGSVACYCSHALRWSNMARQSVEFAGLFAPASQKIAPLNSSAAPKPARCLTTPWMRTCIWSLKVCLEDSWWTGMSRAAAIQLGRQLKGPLIRVRMSIGTVPVPIQGCREHLNLPKQTSWAVIYIYMRER